MDISTIPIATTALYAAILGLMAVYLAFGAGSGRLRSKVSLGTGDDVQLLEAVRKHGNFTEHVPMAIILIGLLELSGGAGSLTLHLLGGGLVLARVAHPMGLSMDNMNHPLRAVGAGLTALITVVAAGMLLWNHFT